MYDFVRGCFAFLWGERIKRYSTRCLCINSIRRGLKCVWKWMDWSWLDGVNNWGLRGVFLHVGIWSNSEVHERLMNKLRMITEILRLMQKAEKIVLLSSSLFIYRELTVWPYLLSAAFYCSSKDLKNASKLLSNFLSYLFFCLSFFAYCANKNLISYEFPRCFFRLRLFDWLTNKNRIFSRDVLKNAIWIGGR